MADSSSYVLQTFIRTSQDALWDALLNPEKTALYYYGARLETTQQPGGPFRYTDTDSNAMIEGELVEITPKTRIVSTFIPGWVDKAKPTRVVFDIEPLGEFCRFTITHERFADSGSTVVEGWGYIASGLKTLLETGQPLGLELS
jgi:uncharacterized protein YndB with AHSA1/START domain